MICPICKNKTKKTTQDTYWCESCRDHYAKTALIYDKKTSSTANFDEAEFYTRPLSSLNFDEVEFYTREKGNFIRPGSY